MRISNLLERWGTKHGAAAPIHAVSLYLPTRDVARLKALATLYPANSVQDIVADLVHAALDELEAAMPYVPGGKVLDLDDQGDQIYEDLGPTPQYYLLSHDFLRRLRR